VNKKFRIVGLGLTILGIVAIAYASTIKVRMVPPYKAASGPHKVLLSQAATIYDPIYYGSYPATLYNNNFNGGNVSARDPFFEPVTVSTKFPTPNATQTYATPGCYVYLVKGFYNPMKECANEYVDIRIAFGSRNTMTPTLTPVPATSTHTLTPTTDNTNVVATTSPTLTYTPTKVADNMHINTLNVNTIKAEPDGSNIVNADSTRTIWGDSTQRNIMQGSDYTISSEGPVTIDADGSVIEKHTTDGARGTSGGYRVLVEYNTPVVYRNYRIPTTHTPVAGVNDFVGEEHFGEYKVHQPESTQTPTLDELVSWGWVQAQMQAGVTVVYTPIAANSVSLRAVETAVALEAQVRQTVEATISAYRPARSAADPTTLIPLYGGEIVQNDSASTILYNPYPTPSPTWGWATIKP
jgi:hypothetical protein